MVRPRFALWVDQPFYAAESDSIFLSFCLLILLTLPFVMLHFIQTWCTFLSRKLSFLRETVKRNEVFKLNSSSSSKLLLKAPWVRSTNSGYNVNPTHYSLECHVKAADIISSR